MGFLLKKVWAFLKLLNSDKGTNQIASGLALGMILGLTPAFSLQTVLVFVCIFLFRVQMGAAFLSAFFFAFPAYLLDPLFHRVGVFFLTLEGLEPLYTALYNMPIVPYTRFSNSIVMGSGIIAIVLTPVMFFVARYIVIKYREQIVARFKSTKFWKIFTATKFYLWYLKYDKTFGAKD